MLTKPLHMHRNILRKFECLISQGGNVLWKLGSVSLFSLSSTIRWSSVVSKASLRILPSVKKFALRNVASIVNIKELNSSILHQLF